MGQSKVLVGFCRVVLGERQRHLLLQASAANIPQHEGLRVPFELTSQDQWSPLDDSRLVDICSDCDIWAFAL